jgi:Flp pilus assembly protein TadG
MIRPKSILAQFRDSEAGGGTAFALFMFMTLAALLGIAVDGTFGWWNKNRLEAAADIGAHAGAVALANKKTEAEMRTAVEQAVQDNLPTTIFGRVIDSSVDVAFAHYDPEKMVYDGGTDPNTVIVSLQRSENRGNPIRTFLLSFAGVPTLDTMANSAAVFDINGVCKSSDGIYAQSTITLSSQTDVGAGFCIHSNSDVWLPQQNSFEPGAYVSMPNLDNCKSKCEVSANPGIVAVESHMAMPDLGKYIRDTYDSFAYANASTTKPQVVTDLFSGVTLGSQTDLIDKGVLSSPVTLGTVVPMTVDQFHSLAELPSGLIYKIDCKPGSTGVKTWLNFSGTVAQMSHAAVITNCGFNFADGARAVGSVLITIRENTNATVTAGSHVTVADPAKACNENERTVLMSLSKVSVPAEFVLSNLTLMVDDDVDIASATSSGVISRGLSIYSSQQVKFSSQHRFRTCKTPDAFLTPTAKVLRLIMPPMETQAVSTL